ncbi:type V CRISPR-associated protein Cas4 [Candidatus Woesearchaeota archaeon]|nr:type V CRISPR-associated protein Cas4 [Candidatus Woesearchaeota archaeon]
MEDNIKISTLNDFIFCPRSIYFHNLYSSYDEHLYQSSYQTRGKNAHKNIDSKRYCSKKEILEGIDVFSEEFGLIGKIDLFNIKNKTLVERKNKIKTIYEGYYLQVYAQFYCLLEMGYQVKIIKLYSISDNKNYYIDLPGDSEKNRLFEVINEMKKFSLEDPFRQNQNKCNMCIYRNLCDYDE